MPKEPKKKPAPDMSHIIELTSELPKTDQPLPKKKKTKPPQGGQFMVCSCPHPEADKWWGKGIRWHNQCKAGSGLGWRCSICLNVKTGGVTP